MTSKLKTLTTTIKDKVVAASRNAGPFMSRKFKDLGAWLKKTFLHPNEAMKTFYALMIIANLCFIYTWIGHYCTIPMGGDYTLQEMTFLYNGYDDWHTFFRTGVFPTWDRSVFLGVDNVGANSFYYLFNPFILILLPFPRHWLTVLQGLEFVPKMVLGGMFFYWYLGSFKFSSKAKRIGAIAFAFSGYSFGYLWFHFIDSVAFLPLTFLGIERVIKDRDLRILLVGFFLNAMTSYFFFVVYMIGGFLYALFRFFQTMKGRSLDENWAVIGCGFISFLVGIFLGAFTLIPGMSVALNMPRVSDSSDSSYLAKILAADGLAEKLKAVFTYEYAQNRVTPLLNFLFMTDECYGSNLLNVYWYDNMANSLYVTTPMLLLFFVSLCDSIREHKVGHVIGVLLTAFLILSPIGFYLFSGFTVGYARYFIVPISWMIVFDLEAYENRRNIPSKFLDLSLLMVLVLDVVACILMLKVVSENASYFNAETDWDGKMMLIVLSVPWVIVSYILMRIFYHKKVFSPLFFGMVSLEAVVMGNVTIIGQGTVNIDYMAGGPANIAEETQIVDGIKAGEGNSDYFRIFNPTADRGNINISMREGYNGLGAFHSVYAYGAQNFLDRSRIPYSYHNWSMGVHNRRYNLETFLGVKYYLVDRIKKDYKALEYPVKYGSTQRVDIYDNPYGYINVLNLTDEQKKEYNVSYSKEFLDYLASDECHKSVLLNTNFIDTGFGFDTVINEDWLATTYYKNEKDEMVINYNAYEDYNEYPLLRYAMLENADYQKFYDKNLYNAKNPSINGQKMRVSTDGDDVKKDGQTFRSSLSTDKKYQEGNDGPIEVYSPYGYDNKMKITIYAGNWPATEAVESGEYASCSLDDPYDTDCLTDYAESNPFEYFNGIVPADTQYDFVTKLTPDGKRYNSPGVLYNSKIVIDLIDHNGNPSPIAPDADPSDPTSGVYLSIFQQQNIEWRLFDKDNKLITFGKHSFSDYKQAHGYYADRPVYRIVGIIQQGTKDDPVYIQAPYIYVQHNSDYQKAIDSLKANAINITKRSDGEVQFTTDYTKNKFVVLNYPKQKGWELKRVDNSIVESKRKSESVTLYNVDGGFIGFEANQGDYQYTLTYKSPYFKEACMVTALGLFITSLALLVYPSINREKRPYPYIYSLHQSTEDELRKEQEAYDTYQK